MATRFDDHFDGPDLDRSVWLPHYLPAWSSLETTAADFRVADSCLTLRIGPAQGIWCAGDHEPPLRVSGVQSGNHTGPVGSTRGQQPFRPGQQVREEQAELWGWTPQLTGLEITARMDLSRRSMASCWLIGREIDPRECAEICVFEVFGDTVVAGESAEVGAGLHAFRDPETPEDFATTHVPLDVSDFHTYGLEWNPDEVRISVDGRLLRTCPNPPRYPMQVMIAVFDFPERGGPTDADHVPTLVVDRMRETEW